MTKSKAVSLTMGSIQTEIAGHNAAGALVRISLRGEVARVHLIGTGASALRAATEATRNNSALCSDATLPETVFFVHATAAALPVERYDCNALQSDAQERLDNERRLASLQLALDDTQRALASLSSEYTGTAAAQQRESTALRGDLKALGSKLAQVRKELTAAQQLLVLDTKVNVTQQSLIERSTTLAQSAATGTQELVKQVEALSASVKTQANVTTEFISNANQKLAAIEAAMKKL